MSVAAVATRPVGVRRTDVVAIAIGIVVTAAGMLAVRSGTVAAWEADVFEVINDFPDALYPVVWPFQQLGALAAGPAVVLGAACGLSIGTATTLVSPLVLAKSAS